MARCKSLPNCFQSTNIAKAKQSACLKRHGTLPINLTKKTDISELISTKHKLISRENKSFKISNFNKDLAVFQSINEEANSSSNEANAHDQSQEYPLRTSGESSLLNEIDKLKKCVRFLEAENELLTQQVERQNLNNLYNCEIENLLVTYDGHEGAS